MEPQFIKKTDEPSKEEGLSLEEREEQYNRDLKVAIDAVKNVNILIEQVNGFVESTLRSYNITNPDILKYLGYMDESDIKHMKYTDIQEFLEKHGNDKDALGQAYIKVKDHSETLLEFSINGLLGLREMQLNRQDIINQKVSFLRDVKEINDNHEKYKLSDLYKMDQSATLEKLKAKAKNIENEYQRNKILKDIEVIETSHECKFLLERLTQGDTAKEVDSVVKTFFDKRRSIDIKERFKTKAKKFNITAPMYRSFFDIEEKYMDEKYHPYNNFFLFYVVRYIVHADPSNKHDVNRVNSLLLRMIYLVQDRYEEKDKEEFIHFIEGFYLYIITKERTELFKEKNVTYKEHPERKKIRNELLDELKSELGPTFKEEYESYDESVLHETLFRIHQSKVVMVKENYQMSKDMKWINNVYKFYEIEQENKELREEKEKLEKEAEEESDTNASVEEVHDAQEETE